MCGDLDDEESESKLEAMLYRRFAGHAQALLAQVPAAPSSDNAAYMELLFSDALTRALKDCEQTDADGRYERLIAQPVVFARLVPLTAPFD